MSIREVIDMLEQIIKAILEILGINFGEAEETEPEA